MGLSQCRPGSDRSVHPACRVRVCKVKLRPSKTRMQQLEQPKRENVLSLKGMTRSGIAEDLGGPRHRARRPSVGSRAIARQIRPRDRAPKTGLGPSGLRPLPRHPSTAPTLPVAWCPACARASAGLIARRTEEDDIALGPHLGATGRLPSGSSRVRDSHAPPINVRRCGRRGLRGNPPSAGPPLRCGPLRDARVAWDASGL
jgi:hypothetical protein